MGKFPWPSQNIGMNIDICTTWNTTKWTWEITCCPTVAQDETRVLELEGTNGRVWSYGWWMIYWRYPWGAKFRLLPSRGYCGTKGTRFLKGKFQCGQLVQRADLCAWWLSFWKIWGIEHGKTRRPGESEANFWLPWWSIKPLPTRLEHMLSSNTWGFRSGHGLQL